MVITRDGFVGSPAFASPEQFANAPLDVRSDVSLGVTLWFALTGKVPFPGGTVEEIRAAQETSALPLHQLKAARVPSRFIAVLKAMLASEPAARPGTTELAAQLELCHSSAKIPWLILAAAIVFVTAGLFILASRSTYQPPKLPIRNAAAREAFLKGRYFWDKRNGPEFETAKTYFERAIALDPGYAEAYAGLADTYQFIANGDRKVRDDYYDKAKKMSRRAIALDPTLAEPHASLGLIAMNYDWDWGLAEREFRRALELNPNYATAHQWYADCLVAQVRFGEAIEQAERARQLNPLSGIINSDTGIILLCAGHTAEAEEKLKETLKVDPGFAQARYWLAALYGLSGRYDQAVAELNQLEREHPIESPNGTAWAGQLGWNYARAGQARRRGKNAPARAEGIRHQLLARSRIDNLD